MFDLLILAKEAATTPGRANLLEGLLEDNDNMVRRTMEQEEDHGELLDDDFFVPFIGLAAAMGSKHFWRVMADWGYDLTSPTHMSHEDGGAQMEVGGWAAQFVDTDRLEYLIKEELFTPFKPTTLGTRLSAGELGMLTDEDERFDFWLSKWQQYVMQARAKARAGAVPNLPMVLGVMIAMGLRGGKTPEGWPESDTLHRRIDRMMDTFLEMHYGVEGVDAQWRALTQNPPLSRNLKVAIQTIEYAASKAQHPFADTTLLLRATEQRQYGLAAGMIKAGAGLDFCNPGDGGAPGYLLQWMASSRNPDANVVWRAWLERAQTEQPWVLPTLPGYMKKPGADYQQWLSQDKDRAKRLVQAVSMSFEAGPALGTQPRPRF